MRGFSKAIIAGNLTRDPELRTTASGANVCSFSVAVNRVYRDNNGEQREEVSFIDCSAWGRLGEMISQYAKKGSSVLVSGRLVQHNYETKDGAKRSHLEITVEDFNFIGAANRDGDAPAGASGATASAPDGTPPSTDNIPEDVPKGDINLNEIPF